MRGHAASSSWHRTAEARHGWRRGRRPARRTARPDRRPALKRAVAAQSAAMRPIAAQRLSPRDRARCRDLLAVLRSPEASAEGSSVGVRGSRVHGSPVGGPRATRRGHPEGAMRKFSIFSPGSSRGVILRHADEDRIPTRRRRLQIDLCGRSGDDGSRSGEMWCVKRRLGLF